MAISSLGVGNNILTQDVIDQLRTADETSRITPIDLKLANQNDKKDALGLIDANMTNFIDSINEIKYATLWNERSATVNSGTSVEVTAFSNTDVQDFTINVNKIATKQIEESGSFASDTDLIANGVGSMKLNIDGLDFTIDYDATTTLKDLKNTINTVAGAKVDATIVQMSPGDFRLVVSSADTGTTQNITMTDNTGALLQADGTTPGDTRLTTGMGVLQAAGNAEFTFNGGTTVITRTSNTIDDLITGLSLTLKEPGLSDVSVAQDRTTILEKFDSFVEKYNSAITELDKMTKSSSDAESRGIFSSDSSVKSMKNSIKDMIDNVGGGVALLADYGFSVDEDGTMTLDKTVLEDKMDKEPVNTQAFFSGGDFTKADLSVVTLAGSFSEMSTKIEGYTSTNTMLDQLKDSITQNISSLEDSKITATERLDSKYDILKKQFAAYGLLISKINSASSMFTQFANAQLASQDS